jgi:hypothetical protein
MNMEKKGLYDDETVAQVLECAPNRMLDDICGIWVVISSGKEGFGFQGQELREFIYLYVKSLIEAGGIVIEGNGPEERDKIWSPATRYGVTPEDVARNVLNEWIAQGEPEVGSYEGIAFTMPDYIDSEDNSNAWHRANPPKL